MDENEAEQNKLAPHEAPAFKSSDVEPALKSLKNLVVKLSKRPVPKKEKPAKTDNSTEETSTSEGEGDGDKNGEGEIEEGGESGEEEGEDLAGKTGPEGGDDSEADGSIEDEL